MYRYSIKKIKKVVKEDGGNAAKSINDTLHEIARKDLKGDLCLESSGLRISNKVSLYYKGAIVRQSSLLTYIYDITNFFLVGD